LWTIVALVVLVAVVGSMSGSEDGDNTAVETTVATTIGDAESTTAEATPTTIVPTTTTASTLPPVPAEGSSTGDDVVEADIPHPFYSSMTVSCTSMVL
jgi:hypothetical protein